ncbi:unnamed protein product [Schistosoma curassoni]|uniref:Uncharacterized protein n=1 Tax=Schistosoma curassoni TaxID=6186 RepID=A0A183JWH0_9TREM|nr:unnamed protein product [Schistosoma curassoni]
MSKQIYCMGQKLGELRKPSYRRYKCLLTVVYAKSSDPLARHYQQQHPVGEKKPDPSGGRNQEEAMEVDRTRIEKSTQLCQKTSPHLESSRCLDTTSWLYFIWWLRLELSAIDKSRLEQLDESS